MQVLKFKNELCKNYLDFTAYLGKMSLVSTEHNIKRGHPSGSDNAEMHDCEPRAQNDILKDVKRWDILNVYPLYC